MRDDKGNGNVYDISGSPTGLPDAGPQFAQPVKPIVFGSQPAYVPLTEDVSPPRYDKAGVSRPSLTRRAVISGSTPLRKISFCFSNGVLSAGWALLGWPKISRLNDLSIVASIVPLQFHPQLWVRLSPLSPRPRAA